MTDYQPKDYYVYRLRRAKETIQEIEKHIENGFWNTAINRMYYACFYAVGSLLAKNRIEVSTHSGSRQKFGQNFVKTGLIDRDLAKHYTELYEKRQKGDYNDFFDFDEETVVRLFPLTKEFVEALSNLINE